MAKQTLLLVVVVSIEQNSKNEGLARNRTGVAGRH
jgi:hypothetical protein